MEKNKHKTKRIPVSQLLLVASENSTKFSGLKRKKTVLILSPVNSLGSVGVESAVLSQIWCGALPHAFLWLIPSWDGQEGSDKGSCSFVSRGIIWTPKGISPGNYSK